LGTYIPHTDDEIESMLAFLGLSGLDELFAVVPEAVKLQRDLELADGVGEPDVLAHLGAYADQNAARSDRLICFAGGGAYDHEIPAVTQALASRSEFVTSYTPYQPEVAQGVLQAIFEFQTMVARIAGLDVSNASLYDGGSSAVEAVNLGVAATGRQTVWVSEGIHPHWRQMLTTFAAGTGHQIRTIPLVDGVTGWPDDRAGGDEAPGVVLVGYPNYLGCLEDLSVVRALCDRTGALMVVGADPLAAGLLRSAGDWGADVMVGEGQMFGTTLGFGGPYLGLFACSSAHVRRLPGRLVGQTVDVEDRIAYVSTLRAREQDIRREKATSNVCTNQTLMAVTAAVQLGWLGTSGLVEVATRCARAARYTRHAVLGIDAITPWTEAPVLREFAVRLPLPADLVIDRMADAGFLAGISLEGAVDDGGNGLLIAATERRTAAQIDGFADALAKAIA
jgi:glycine dehydrogenase subunit 1